MAQGGAIVARRDGGAIPAVTAPGIPAGRLPITEGDSARRGFFVAPSLEEQGTVPARQGHWPALPCKTNSMCPFRGRYSIPYSIESWKKSNSEPKYLIRL